MLSTDTRQRLMWLAVALALLAAGAYLLIGYHILPIGDLQASEAPAAIIYVAAGCYLAGGLLILLRWRWLWIFGALINALVILFFARMYLNRPVVMFSPGGLASKAAQLLLELCLLVLIVTDGRRTQLRLPRR